MVARPAAYDIAKHTPSECGKNSLINSKFSLLLIRLIEYLWSFISTHTIFGDALEMVQKTPFDFFLDLKRQQKFRLIHKTVHNITDNNQCLAILENTKTYKKGIAWLPVSYVIGEGIFTDIDHFKHACQRSEMFALNRTRVNNFDYGYLSHMYIDELLQNADDTKHVILKYVEHIMLDMFICNLSIEPEHIEQISRRIPRILKFLNNKSFGSAIIPLSILKYLHNDAREYYDDVMYIKKFAVSLDPNCDPELVMPILFAASTLANLIVWMILELSLDPNLQDEIKSDDNSKLNKVINEVWRLYPPIWAHPRQSAENKDLYFVNMFARNRMVEYAGENPNDFSIERDTPLPSRMFGASNYSCPGQRMSRDIITAFFSELLERGTICTDAVFPIQMKSETALTPRDTFRTKCTRDDPGI